MISVVDIWSWLCWVDVPFLSFCCILDIRKVWWLSACAGHWMAEKDRGRLKEEAEWGFRAKGIPLTPRIGLYKELEVSWEEGIQKQSTVKQRIVWKDRDENIRGP